MEGMVSTCELSINAVMSNKPKLLTGLGPKSTVAGTGLDKPCHGPHERVTRGRTPGGFILAYHLDVV